MSVSRFAMDWMANFAWNKQVLLSRVVVAAAAARGNRVSAIL
jgi:hypothetical protein